MSDIPNFAKLVPGFDFLQGLVKNAGSALPSMGQWVAPTLNPEELQKRIDELKTVQFWLEQNARMLATTIQALEVQRMTLSTLKTMNVQMTDLRDAMKVAPVASAGSAASAAVGSVANSFGADALMQAARNAMDGIANLAKPAAVAAEPPPVPEPAPSPPAAEAPALAAAGVVDPMQWWGALTKQFTQLAATAMKDSATDAARNLAGAMMKQGMDAAGETIKKAVGVPAGVAAKAMSAATQAASATGAKAAAKKDTAARTAAAKTAAAARKTPARKSPARKTAARAAKPRAS